MPVSTRDLQYQRRASRVAIETLAAITENITRLNGVSFDDEDNSHSSSISSVTNNMTVNLETQTKHTNISRLKNLLFKNYRWKMSHYFYIHLMFFIFNGLFGGLIIFLIENYSSFPNPYMVVTYIDAWFMCVSTICSCGLSTLDFAQLSRASQSAMMIFAFLSGFAISTLPALIIKTRTHKTTHGINVDNDNENDDDQENYELELSKRHLNENLSSHIRDELARLPKPEELRYRAYIMCIVLILGLFLTINIIGLLIIGIWLQTHANQEYLMQNNATLNPWYVASMLTLFSFNQNGLAPFSTGLTRFVDDIFLNIIIILVIFSFCPYYSNLFVLVIIFDYILLNNHHLSTLLYPTLQTRIYFVVTLVLYLMSITISLILDLQSKYLKQYTPNIRIMIFLFQTINLRFCGFQTFDISLFSTATLLVYLLLMATKPQMLCALDESPFEIYWLTLEAQAQVNDETNLSKSLPQKLQRAMSMVPGAHTDALVFNQIHHFLRRQSLITKKLAKKELFRNVDNKSKHSKRIKSLRLRLFLIHFIRALFKHTFDFFLLTRTWLFVFIFLICAFEYHRMAPNDPHITLLKIIFEIISAFGGVGMSLGYPNKATSFASVLSTGSKVLLIVTMLMGRHRGLLASMKDQEVIKYSAIKLLIRRREEYIFECQKSRMPDKIDSQMDYSSMVTHL
uniref:Uncharacterized protein n=1 Tax=Adineta vaga TaxID=104782 RepID=B3G4R2_ADIVA|nr:unknown [Adineta vaga]